MTFLFSKRATCMYNGEDEFDDCTDSWWWSDAGLAVRYALVVLFFVVIISFLLFSYLHAQRRLRRGLPPLGYHRWLVSRRHHPRYNYQNPSAYYQGTEYGGQAYGMQNYPPAPPAYNTWDAPPQYQPPVGGSKALANQNLNRDYAQTDAPAGQSSVQPNTASQAQDSEVQYPAPSHPPPGHVRDV